MRGRNRCIFFEQHRNKNQRQYCCVLRFQKSSSQDKWYTYISLVKIVSSFVSVTHPSQLLSAKFEFCVRFSKKRGNWRRYLMIRKWSSARNTRSTCKAKTRSYLRLASRSLRRSWRNAAKIFIPKTTLIILPYMTPEHALTIAQVPNLIQSLFSDIKVLNFDP